MRFIAKYIHGSADSLDVDTYYVVDEMPEFQQAKAICDLIKDENANLITIENGIVAACYKGTIDECNNSLYTTYKLHKQTCPLLIERLVKRDIGIKYIRGIRGILSHLSRSQYRQSVKPLLKSGSLKDKAEWLNTLDFSTIDYDSLNGHISGKDILKVIAFQLGQMLGLKDGIELYTKKDISNQYPELKPFLYRHDTVCYDAIHDAITDVNVYLNAVIVNEADNILTLNDGSRYDVKYEKKL